MMFEEFTKEKARRGLEGTEAAAIVMPWQNKAEYNDAGAYIEGSNAEAEAKEKPPQAVDEQVCDESDAAENKKIREIFFDFLKARGAFTDYSKNLENYYGHFLENYHGHFFITKFIALQKKYKPKSYVDLFSWKNTGNINYWFMIREQWHKCLQDKNKSEEQDDNEKNKKEPEKGGIIINHPWAGKDSLRQIIDSDVSTMGNASTGESEQLKKEFFEFLFRRNAYAYYFENLKNIGEIKNFLELQKKWSEEFYILSAFRWENTIQGDSFWKKIDNEWREYLMNKNEPEEQIDNEDFKERFFYFLDSYNYLAHYLLDISRLKNISFDDFQKTVCPEKYLTDAFTWRESIYCWSEINSKWQDELKKIKDENNE